MKLIFLKNCLRILNRYVNHLTRFETKFESESQKVNNFETKNKIGQIIDCLGKLETIDALDTKMTEDIVYYFVKTHENILKTRTKLRVVNKIMNQTGEEFIYKSLL